MCFVCLDLYFLSYLISFFFFFKQKTAYEMRISDWSSDVCSSDLPVERAAVQHLLGPPRHLKGQVAQLRRLAAGAELLQPFRLEEIGRASCRESVCQYV